MLSVKDIQTQNRIFHNNRSLKKIEILKTSIQHLVNFNTKLKTKKA